MPHDPQSWLAVADGLTPPLVRDTRTPVRAVRVEADAAAFGGWAVRDDGPAAARLATPLGRGDSVILDFGEHWVGYLRVTVRPEPFRQDAPARLRFIVAEVPAELAEPFDPYVGQLSRAWLQDETVNLDVLPHDLALPRRYAGRYVRIDVVDTSPNYRVRLERVRLESVTSAGPDLHAPPPGTLPADLERIDAVSIRTLRNCMQTVFEDGPKRDRRLWLGDLRLQALANYASFGNFALVKRCLYLFAATTRDGRVMADVFERPHPPRGDHYIVDYAALFAPTLLDYAEVSGDSDAARDLWPVAAAQARDLVRHVGPDGLFVDPGGVWIFIDWHPTLDKQAAMHAVLLYGLRQTARLAERVGRAGDVAFITPLVARMTEAARRHWLDPARGVFTSGPARQVSWASQAWMILAGVMSPDEGRAAWAALARDAEAIRPAGAYLYHHVVEAMLACGMRDEARALVVDYWGGMVDRGADTFWEVYDPADARFSPYGNHKINSYCHAWSCTPAYFIRRKGLGKTT